MATTVGPTVSELLRNSRFEILPLDGIEDQVREHLPTDVKVTVTASPREGLEAALDLSDRLARAGYLRITMKIGMAESARYLRHNSGVLARVLKRQFKPDRLLRDLTPVVSDPAANVAGFHLYTFNEVGRTERWRRRTIERLRAR